MISSKKFVKIFVILFALVIVVIGAMTYIVDPFFHFHAPLDGFGYYLNKELYQNDGISRNFEYDAMITGTSMSQNFKTTQFDELFETNSIKTCFAGASFNEINEHIDRATIYNPDLKVVFRSLDVNRIDLDADERAYDLSTEYLYDNNILNDVNYLLNKETLLRGTMLTIVNTVRGYEMTTFDDYANWGMSATYGTDVVLNTYIRPEQSNMEVKVLTDDDKLRIEENIKQNVIKVAQDNPEIEFYSYYTPYSILYYDELNQNASLSYQLDVIEYATSLIVEQENIKLFSFLDLYDIVTDLDNYKDAGHYSGEINEMMLEHISKDEHLLTIANYEDYFEEIKSFYIEYDYNAIFECVFYNKKM